MTIPSMPRKSNNSKFSDWGEYYKQMNFGAARFLKNIYNHAFFIDEILKCLTGPAKLLEVGVGTGSMATFFSYLGHNVIAVDNDREIIYKAGKFADKMNGRAKFLNVDAYALSRQFKENDFDLVYSQGFFEHFGNDDILELIRQQLLVAPQVVFSVPSKFYGEQSYGNERLMEIKEWTEILKDFQTNIQGYMYSGRGIRRIVRNLFKYPKNILPLSKYRQILIKIKR